MSKNGQTAAVLLQDPKKIRRIRKELNHLEEIFRDVDPNKRDFVQRHIEQLAWFNISIADLQEKVDKWGTLVAYDNGGGQSGVKPNPDVKTLLDYQKCCNTIVRTLIPLVPNRMDGGKLEDLFLTDDKTPEEIEEEYQAEEEKRKRINAEIAAAQKQLEESRAKNGN